MKTMTGQQALRRLAYRGGMTPQQALRRLSRHVRAEIRSAPQLPANPVPSCPGCRYRTPEYHTCGNGYTTASPTTAARSQRRPARVETAMLRR